MKKSKKILSIILAILIFVPTLSFFVMGATNAVGKTVTLAATQTGNTSGSVYGKWKYITNDTENAASSSQRMYAVMQYRHNLVYINETGVYLSPGSSAPYTSSFTFSESKYWRLELTPERPEQKGVSGSGVIYEDI